MEAQEIISFMARSRIKIAVSLIVSLITLSIKKDKIQVNHPEAALASGFGARVGMGYNGESLGSDP